MFSILYNIIISPIELILEIIFELMFSILGNRETNQGLAVIGVSITVSLLTLPLYYRADAVQQKTRDIQQKMSRWVNHIRKTFKGDERFMMLRTYYRINGYSPLSALNGSISLLLEIPFFIAAYHFLSHLDVLNGASFWIIADLGKPDGLLKIGAVSINILPIMMTLINCIASAVYLKGFPLKDRVQTYGMAVIFLVLLYSSPSGLVVYWTCNNIFSLIKNIFYKLKHPKETAYILCAVIGTLITVSVISSGILSTKKKLFAMLVFQCIAVLPLVIYLAKRHIKFLSKKTILIDKAEKSETFNSFFLPGVFLTLLLGVLIPSSVIASSPAEFINLLNYRNPFLFLINSTCYAIGFFIVWMGIIRHMLSPSPRRVLSLILWTVSIASLLNYMCFGKNLGLMSPFLVFDNDVSFSKSEQLINLLVLCGSCGVCITLFRFRKVIIYIYVILILCIGSVSIYQIHDGQHKLENMAYIKDSPKNTEIKPIIPLSKKGKNVIVFMLDRAIDGYVPYILEEKPELKEKFAGFTCFPNTLSFGFTTNYGAPPLFGGYEYTPVEMNRRSSVLLADKHNEALKLLPYLFSQQQYKVTVCDPPYAGYNWIPDLSIFKDIPNTSAYQLTGIIKDDSLGELIKEKPLSRNERNFFCYSVFKTLPSIVSKLFYDRGDYFGTNVITTVDLSELLNDYSIMNLLPRLTFVEDSDTSTFLSIQNSLPHFPSILQMPDYEPKAAVNNTGFRTAAEGHIDMDRKTQVAHYHTNMATFLLLAKWFDFMRENGVYDNTRIILAADHGFYLLHQFKNMIFDDLGLDVQSVNPLLMFKDFNAKEFTTSEEFMTQADVPTLALKNIINNPINPYTGKEISDKEKTAHPQVITTSTNWETTKNNGTVFDSSDGEFFSVHDDIFKRENWSKISP